MDNSKCKVTIDVEVYEELLLFKNNLQSEFYACHTWHNQPSYYYVTKEQAVSDLQIRLDNVKKEIYDLKAEKVYPIEKIKRMSIFEFIRWKRQK